MKNILSLLFCLVFLWAPAFASDLTLHDTPVQIYFSPDGGAQAAIINALDAARESVCVQAYSFTNVKIAKALANAFRRGVKVEAVLDQTQQDEKYAGATYIRKAHVPVYFDAMHAVAHNKIMIIDNETVITGSFNFTNAAEKDNAENLLVLHDKALAKLYMANWLLHKEHSQKDARYL